MSRQDFIEKLRMALNGRLSSSAVAENVNYYEDYINVEIRKGRTEEDVLASLGDPRLIAKTIIQTNNGVGADMTQSARYRSAGGEEGHVSGSDSAYDEALPRIFRIPGWLMTLLVIIIALFVICIVCSVLSFLLPLIIAMAAVMLIVKIFRDWLN